MPLRLAIYLLRLSLLRCLAALGLLVMLYASVDMVEVSSMTQLSIGTLVMAYLLKVPTIITQVLPLAAIFGTLATLAHLRRWGEWDALRMIGLPPLKLAAGLMIAPVVLTVGALLLTNFGAPASMARYEGIAGAKSATGENSWIRDGDWMLSGGEGEAKGELAVLRDREGSVVRWHFGRGDRHWDWSERGGWSGGVSPGDIPSGAGTSGKGAVPMVGLDGMVGMSLTSGQLGDVAAEMEARGLDARPLRAQLALRWAIVAACFIVSALGLLLALLGDTSKVTRLIPLGLLVAAAYWIVLVVAWNGVVWGVWGDKILSLGVPATGVSAMMGLLLYLRVRRRA